MAEFFTRFVDLKLRACHKSLLARKIWPNAVARSRKLHPYQPGARCLA
jgi:hypothetical protein